MISIRILDNERNASAFDSGIQLAQVNKFSHIYPGGSSDVCSFFIETDVSHYAPAFIRTGFFVEVYFKNFMVWDGRILSVTRNDSRSRYDFTAVGLWGDRFNSIRTSKFWMINNYDLSSWAVVEWAPGVDKTNFRRDGLFAFYAKALQWNSGDRFMLDLQVLDADAHTIKKITFDYELASQADRDWSLVLSDASLGSTIWSVARTTTGVSTGSVSLTAPTDFTADNDLRFIFRADATQTPSFVDTDYGEIKNLKVYTENSSVNFHEVIQDVAALVPEISTNISRLDSGLTRDLGVFKFSSAVTLARVIREAAFVGSVNNNPIGYGLTLRSLSAAADDKPLLFSEEIPDVSTGDYEYRFAPGEGTISLTLSLEEVVNSTHVLYTDTNNFSRIESAAGNAALEDTTSQALYGERHSSLQAAGGTSAAAVALGTKEIERGTNSLIRSVAVAPVKKLYTANGVNVPAAMVRPGKRLLISSENTGFGRELIVLITKTVYNVERDAVQMSVGIPDDLSILI